MPQFKQAGRLLQFSSSVLDKDALLIQSLDGVETMSRLFEFHAELLAVAGTAIDPFKLIGTKATITVTTATTGDTRYITGIIASIDQTAGDENFDVYTAQLVPPLWQLTLNANCRIFQTQTIMQVVKAIISPYGLSLSDDTKTMTEPLDNITQYNETDFDFISRLCEQYGIFYWFDHTEDDCKIMFGDGAAAYSSEAFALDYAPQGAGNQERYAAVIHDFTATTSMVSAKYTSTDYDFVKKNVFKDEQDASALLKNALEIFDYPLAGGAHIKATGQSSGAASLIKQAHFTQAYSRMNGAKTFHGVSTSAMLYPGSILTLQKHSISSWNADYLLVQVSHHAIQTPAYQGDSVAVAPYTTRFVSIPSSRIFTPLKTTPRPRIHGPQPALVTTANGEEIHLDPYGRVKVQFTWDRLGKSDENSSAWLRVAQAWAGNGWGTYFWPRKGDEVLVQFLNGDPDDPIVMGSVYNGVNTMKYTLPDNGTRSGILTRSSKGGTAANANELRFEDKKGSEEVYINAEKDMNVNIEAASSRTVGASESISVGGDRSVSVSGNQTVSVSKNQTITVGGNQTATVKGNNTTTVKGNSAVYIDGTSDQTITGVHKHKYAGDTHITHSGALNEKVSGNHSMQTVGSSSQKVGTVYVVDSGQEVHLKGGMTVVIEAGMDLTLSGPGGFISIGPAGVTIQGTMVMINSGGAAGSGSPGTFVDPALPAAPPPDPPPPAAK